jgi:hypothetical protein
MLSGDIIASASSLAPKEEMFSYEEVSWWLARENLRQFCALMLREIALISRPSQSNHD